MTRLKDQMFNDLQSTGGMYIPLYRDVGNPNNLRRPAGSKPADFPAEMMQSNK